MKSLRYIIFSGLLTKKFINLIKHAKDGVLDLNKAADTLEVIMLINNDLRNHVLLLTSFSFNRYRRGVYMILLMYLKALAL